MHRGLSANVEGKIIHAGNADYLNRSGISTQIPVIESSNHRLRLAEGCSPIYIAENRKCVGIIYIKHEVRTNVIEQIKRLKAQGIEPIMLTGDSMEAAQCFNKANGFSFHSETGIYAEQTPKNKEQVIEGIIKNAQAQAIRAAGAIDEAKKQQIKNEVAASFAYVGDGLNDGPCERMIAELGGVSCSMTSEAKVSFFSGLVLTIH